MALKLNEVEQYQDLDEIDDSIELTDDDKNYIEKLVVERYTFITTNHREGIKCILPCHICEKIELSTNPKSTSTFLDFIFMEHENDFEFTREKRQKIIRSLVNEFIDEETKAENTLRNVKTTKNKIKNLSRKSLLVQSAQRYLEAPLRMKNAVRILHERRTKVRRFLKYREMSECLKSKKAIRTSTINKVQSHLKTTYPKAKSSMPNASPENIRHTIIRNFKPDRTRCQTVEKINVRPTSVIKDVKPHETESKLEFKQHPLKITQADGIKQHVNNTKEMDKNNRVPKSEFKPTSVVSRVNPEDNREKDSMNMVRANGKIPIKKRLNYHFEGIEKERIVPMKDPENPFYIPDDYVNIALYQDGLVRQGWNPTQVLYEICGYCGWGKPEFLEGGYLMGGFLCCVRVKGVGFMARVRGQTKKIARHHASTNFLNYIGFKFNFNVFSSVPMKSINPFGEERLVLPS